MTKPVIVVTQGDPLAERGISAITRNVASRLGVKRCLVYCNPKHALDADKHDVIYEIEYSQVVDFLRHHSTTNDNNLVNQLLEAVDRRILEKNKRRKQLGLDPLEKDYALLQEVTKAALKIVCGGVTVAHTTDEIPEFSITSFYQIGIDLGLIDETDMVAFA